MDQNIRNEIIQHIETISNADRILEYQKNVAIAYVPDELICGWFDDLYHPETGLFEEQFSQDELKVLKEFNDFFEKRVDKIPDFRDNYSLDEFIIHPLWIEVMNEAGSTLASIEKRKSI